MQRLNFSPHGVTGEGSKHETWQVQHQSSHHYNYSGTSSRQRQRRVERAATATTDDFGDFPATPQITTPQVTNRRRGDEPQSRPGVRFAEDDRHQVLILDGSDQRQHHHSPASDAVAAPAVSSLDFSMIATPGGKLARMVDNHGFYTPSEAATTDETMELSSGKFGGKSLWTTGTPFRSMLRGVVSSTPNMDPRQMLMSTSKTPYAAAREKLQQIHGKNINVEHANSNGNDVDKCTALEFARSAPVSGYLRKMGKNIPTFKRRFFVLKPSTHLYYFLSPSDVEPRGCIDLDMATDGSNGEEGGCGSCDVREIGSLPDGTFQFELFFDEEKELDDNTSSHSDGGSQTSQKSSTKRQFHRQKIVLEARTEEIGREWMAKLQSERLSSAKEKVEFLRASLAEMKSISSKWGKSACEEAMRADETERQRNTAISEAKSWEARFTNLNEALRLLGKRGGNKTSDFLTEAFQGLDAKNTNLNHVSQRVQAMHNDYQQALKREEEAKDRIARLEKRAQEAESRAANAEKELARVREDNLAMQNNLKKARREKKILVKEVRSLHSAVAEDKGSKQSDQNEQHDLRSTNSQSVRSRGAASSSNDHGTSSAASYTKRKPKEIEQQLVLELEEHVMSGLRLSEQFLTLNRVDNFFDEGSIDENCINHEGNHELDDNVHPRERQSTCHPPSKTALNLSPARITNATNGIMQSQRVSYPLGSLLDETDDNAFFSADPKLVTVPGGAVDKTICHSNEGGFNLSYTADSVQGSDLLTDVSQYEEGSNNDNPINQNLNERFSEKMQIDTGKKTINHHDTQHRLFKDDTSACQAPPSQDLPSSVSESSRSRVTDNGNATTKLECSLTDVEESPSKIGSDGKVYHITFYSKTE